MLVALQELDAKTVSRLEKAVSKSEYSQGKKLKVVTKVRSAYHAVMFYRTNGYINVLQVNPDLVGGLVVEIGDRTVDLSVSSKIAKMNKALTDAL